MEEVEGGDQLYFCVYRLEGFGEMDREAIVGILFDLELAEELGAFDESEVDPPLFLLGLADESKVFLVAFFLHCSLLLNK